MSAIPSEHNRQKLREIAAVIPAASTEHIAELLNGVFGLGYCQGAIETASDILSVADGHKPQNGEPK